MLKGTKLAQERGKHYKTRLMGHEWTRLIKKEERWVIIGCVQLVRSTMDAHGIKIQTKPNKHIQNPTSRFFNFS